MKFYFLEHDSPELRWVARSTRAGAVASLHYAYISSYSSSSPAISRARDSPTLRSQSMAWRGARRAESPPRQPLLGPPSPRVLDAGILAGLIQTSQDERANPFVRQGGSDRVRRWHGCVGVYNSEWVDVDEFSSDTLCLHASHLPCIGEAETILEPGSIVRIYGAIRPGRALDQAGPPWTGCRRVGRWHAALSRVDTAP